MPQINEWGILDTTTFQERRGKFEFRVPRAFRSRLVFFPESMQICIYETGDFNQKEGKLTFMSYPQSHPASPPIELWQILIENTFNYTIVPLNRSNRLVIYHAKVENNINWTVYDIDKRTIVKH
jgi:hypothetical protein